MTRRNMLLALASAAVIGPSLSLATSQPLQSIDATLTSTITSLEKDCWEAFKNHNATVYSKLISPDFYEIKNDGQLTSLEEVLADMSNWETVDYSMEDVFVTSLNDETAAIRYKLHAKYVHKGTVCLETNAFALTTWARTGSAWKAHTYQETPLPAKAA